MGAASGAGRAFYFQLRGAAQGADSGCGCLGRAAAWRARTQAVPRLLRPSLLSAAVRVLWPVDAGLPAAAQPQRWGPPRGGGAAVVCAPAAPGQARRGHRAPGPVGRESCWVRGYGGVLIRVGGGSVKKKDSA